MSYGGVVGLSVQCKYRGVNIMNFCLKSKTLDPRTSNPNTKTLPTATNNQIKVLCTRYFVSLPLCLGLGYSR